MTGRPRKVAPLGITLDPATSVPLHRQIGEQIRHAILERRLAPGLRLPSSRLMAAELNCARGTVLMAVDQLVAEGYLVAQAGSGLSVAANLPDEMLAPPVVHSARESPSRRKPVLARRAVELLADEPADAVLDGSPRAFPTGQPDRDAFPFPLWAKLLERDWRKPAWSIAGAPHPFGDPRLRSAIAAYLGMARGFSCDAGAIVITLGLRQSLSLFAGIALDGRDETWIEEPGFVGTREALAMAGVKAVAVPVDASGFPLEAAMALAPHARLAVVAPSHQFPLGVVLSLQRRLALLSWAERTNGWIAEDDFDGEYRYAGRPLAPLRALDRTGRVAYLGSFSKLLFPALRLSYVVLPDALVPAAEKVMAAAPARASMLGQGALARFIADGHFTAHLRRTRLLYSARQQVLIAAARRHLRGLLQVEPDPGGMHLVARPHTDLEPKLDDRAVTAAAAAESIGVSPLSACYRNEPRVNGLILGYAATPADAVEPAIVTLRNVLLQLYKPAHAK
jgi:GntR family transcriptional regulator/MocR family aminotransferase